MRRKTLLGVIACLLVCIGAQAGPIVGQPASAANCYPFGCHGTRYQQVYAASVFTGPITITDITFYNSKGAPGTISPGTYTFHLSTTSKAVDGLDSVFANNVGSDDAFFAVLAGGGSAFPSFTVVGTPFTYNPGSGNLLLDMFVTNSTSSGTVFLDSRTGDAGGVFSRMHDFGGGTTGYGLVTGFNESGAVPEPATYAMLAGGLLLLLAGRRRNG